MDHKGVPLGSIQRILGHENRATTEIYLRTIGNAERDAMAIYEQARQKNSHTDSHMARNSIGNGCGKLLKTLELAKGIEPPTY